MNVKEEHEVRVILREPDPVLAHATNKKEYTLVDTYYLPERESPIWKIEHRNLRIRKFGHAEAEIILSVPKFKGIVKYGKKYFVARGREEDLAEVLMNLGFTPFFEIRRMRGYFLDYLHWNIALEEIEGIGWSIDVDVADEEEAWKFIKTLGENAVAVLREPLPAHYCKTFNIKI